MQASTMMCFLLSGLLEQFCRRHAREMAVNIIDNDKAVTENTQPLEVLQLRHLYFEFVSGMIMHERHTWLAQAA